MKKFTLILIALAIGFGLKAQTPLTEAVDFTATDVHGNEIHLFDILDNGQAVLIDFFFSTCTPCYNSTPKIIEAYETTGCNMYDVFFMEISTRDTDAQCLEWINELGVEYPTISSVEGGGLGIATDYGITACPTVILIMPNHEITIQDIWPIPDAQTVISALQEQGIELHDCNTPSYDPEVSITIADVTETTITATFTPNEDCPIYYYMQTTDDEVASLMSSTGLELPEIIEQYGFSAEEELMQTFMELTPETEYLICAVPTDVEGNLYEVVQEYVVTTAGGGGAEIAPDFTATDIDGNEIHLYDILDAGQTVLINFFMVDDYCGLTMPYMTETYADFGCNQHDVFYMEINPLQTDDACRTWVETYDVQYPTISRTGGGNTIVQNFVVGTFPAVMIIRPDHTIAIRDLYPIESSQTIIDALEGLGCEQHECPTFDETLTFSMDTINLAGDQYELHWITLYNNTAEDAIVTNICDEKGWLAFNIDGEEIYCNDPIEITIPQGESKELGVVCNVVAKSIVSDVVTLSSNLPDASFVVILEEVWSVNENATSVSLYPNPAHESVTLKGESLGTVSIFNALGQKVDEFQMEDTELNINTSRYENGVYFVKTDGQTLRFVVTH